ncbi:MAG: dihydroorotate dehydrogenase [Synergistetes bacterium]|nr:dihydroorotate dehydrogenase [Synergistota bacterium]
MIYEEICRIREKLPLGSNIFYMSIEAEAIAHKATPGQFVMIRVSESFDPFLRRPLSIAGRARDQIEILFSVTGRGTSLLSKMEPKAKISVRGPLGSGFPKPKGKPLIFIGGGIGIAPLLFAYQFYPSRTILGIKDRNWKDFYEWIKARIGENLAVFSEDGSIGSKGNCIDGAEKLFNKESEIWACGPEEMISYLKKRIGGKVSRILVSLEARMACGIGGCYGCSIETQRGRRKVCIDGPVFELEEVMI